MTKLQQYLVSVVSIKCGPVITTTFKVVQTVLPTMDMEILIPIDKEIESDDIFKFKKDFMIIFNN
jgi:hypothetical protein